MSFKDKLKSLSFQPRGSTKKQTVKVLREDDGSVGGTQTYHDSGRVDANVFAEGIVVKQEVYRPQGMGDD